MLERFPEAYLVLINYDHYREAEAHLRAVWACALGGFPSVTVAVAPKLTPQAELRF